MNCVPLPIKDAEVLTPVPVILFGNRVFADNQVKMRSEARPSSNIAGVLKRGNLDKGTDMN